MTQPYIPIREVTLCCPNCSYWNAMSLPLRQKAFMPFWSDDRLHQHVAMLHAFGFNAVQTTLIGQVPSNAGATMNQWQSRVDTIIEAARRHDMSVNHFAWGSCYKDVASNTTITRHWHDAAQRDDLLTEYDRLARSVADKVDRVVTHWVDPGGPDEDCPECSISTAVKMHNALIDRFRDRNARIDGYFSNWMMYPDNADWHGWPGYRDVTSILKDPNFDAASGLAIGIMNIGADGERLDHAGQLKADDLHAVADAGRKAGVWGWYTTDVEIQPAIHVHTSLLQNYFRSLPAETSPLLSWHTVDDNCHGLNMHNLFIAGHLMQDPSLDARDLLRQYAQGFVGLAAAPAFVRALDAVEYVRCRSRRYNVKVDDPHESLHADAADIEHLPPDWLDESQSKVDAALEEIATLSLPGGHVAAWPVSLAPEEFVAELAAHLKSMQTMITFLRAAAAVRQRAAAGASRSELKTAIGQLPRVSYDPAHTAGLEAQAFQQQMQTLTTQCLA